MDKQPDRQFTSETWLTSLEVADLLGFNVSSVINWSKQGRLKCFRTPGNHRRFVVGDLVEFIRARGWPMPKALAQVAASMPAEVAHGA